MRMATAFALALVVGVSALVSVSSKAYAVNSNISGTMCRFLSGVQESDIVYSALGVSNGGASTNLVVCPVVRSPTATNDAVNVYVDGWGDGGIGCTLNSFDYNGTLLESASFSDPPFGTFDQYLSVTGTYWGTASVVCVLPSHNNGAIYDIDVVQ